MNTMQIYEACARGEMTPQEAADALIEERIRRCPWWSRWWWRLVMWIEKHSR
jgi:hypothetical protein